MSQPIHKDEYPREKMIRNGANYLSDYELLAIVLNTGTKNENVLELSKRITSKYSLKDLCSQSVSKLTMELGVGEAKACKVLAIAELSRRLNLPSEESPVIKSAKDVFELLMPRIAHLKVEHLVGVYLNSRKKVVKITTIFIGSLDESLINSREIFKIALEENASAIILVHNHPSGDCMPSKEDIKSTSNLKEAGELMGVEVLDHIILGEGGYFSFRDGGLF